MLSVIILSQGEAAPLARTISALVPAIAEGLVGDGHVLADKAMPPVEAVVDAAGCELHVGSLRASLASALAKARGNVVLLLPAGAVPESGWWLEVSDHLRRHATESQAVFAYGSTASGPFARFGERLAAAFRQMAGRPSPRQGLIIRREMVPPLRNDTQFPPRPVGRFTVLRSASMGSSGQ